MPDGFDLGSIQDFFTQGLLGPGLVALVIAIIAWLGDHRRRKRKHADAVGWMNWTSLFFFAAFAAVLLLGGAARQAFSG